MDKKFSKYKGVTWIKRDKRWRAQIQRNGKLIYLGHFKDEKKAAVAYYTKARQLLLDEVNMLYKEIRIEQEQSQ